MREMAPNDNGEWVVEAEIESFRGDLGPSVVATKTARTAMVLMFAKELDRPYSGDDLRDGYRDRPVLKKPFMHKELVEILTMLLRLAKS